MSAADRARHAQAVAEVFAFMSRCGLGLDDLTNVGGADLESSDKGGAGKARHVQNCWALMARLGMKYAELDPAISPARPIILAIPECQVERQRAWAQWYAKAREAYETELKKRQLKNPEVKLIDWCELPLIEDRVEDFLPTGPIRSHSPIQTRFSVTSSTWRKHPPESPLFSTTYEKETSKVKSLKNNKKTDDHSVGSPGTSPKGRWKHKRRLAPVGDPDRNPETAS